MLVYAKNSIIELIFNLLITSAVTAFTERAKSNVVLYWGQASAGAQHSLSSYCQSTDADMYIISFLADFPKSYLTISGCEGKLDTKCPQLASEIKTCQQLGKKVLLSLGGADGKYGFSSDEQAREYADVLWNSFGAGSSTPNARPFGDVVFDGFDFDIENGNSTGYAALATQLRAHFASAPSTTFYLGAAPQCVYPDISLGDALDRAWFDFVSVQFYNNACQIGADFNWHTWVEYVRRSPNPAVKLLLGLPGSESAATSGYVTPAGLSDVLREVRRHPNFGGVMVWDASQAFSNMVDGASFAASMKAILESRIMISEIQKLESSGNDSIHNYTQAISYRNKWKEKDIDDEDEDNNYGIDNDEN